MEYGGGSNESYEELLIDEEIQVDIIVLSQLSPIPIEDLLSLTKTPASLNCRGRNHAIRYWC